MSNRDLLKEAIADAKAVKEMAISNAKAALEEAFTPQLKSLLEKKLQAMDEEEINEEVELEESDDLALESLLQELEDEKIEEAKEEEEEEEKEDAKDDAEEDFDLDDMSEEDLKAFIESVVDEMVAAGELEGGEEENMEVDMEMPAEEAEVEMDMEMPAEEPMMETIELEEDYNTAAMSLSPQEFQQAVQYALMTLGGIVGGGVVKANAKEIGQAIKGAFMKADKGEAMKEMAHKDAELEEAKMKMDMEKEEKGKMKEELNEAYSVIESLQTELNEINLLNSKLLYTNKIFKAKNLTEAQKLKVLGSFDKAETVKEVKLVYETLSQGLVKVNATPERELVKENKSFVSKPVGMAPQHKQPVVETTDLVNRFQKLAGLK